MRAFVCFLLLAAIARAAPDNLPSDCWFVAHFDVAALRKTATYAKLAPLVASAFEAIGLDEAGLKPEDIASLTMGWTGAELDLDGAYVVLRGKIDAARFEEYLAAEGEYTATKRDGMTVFTPIEENPDFPRPHAAVFPGGPILVAPSGGLEKLLATIKPDAPRSPVSELLATAQEAQVVGGGVVTPKIRELLRADADMTGLAGFKAAVVTWKFGEKIEVTFRGTAEGEEEAKRAQDALAAELARETPMLKDRVQLKRDGAVVTGTLTLGVEEMVALGTGEGVEEVEGQGEAEDEASPPER